MKQFSKIFFYFICLFLLIWIAPWCYAFFSAKNDTPLLTLYSSVHKGFLNITRGDTNGSYWCDDNNVVFSREEADSLLPFFYIRQLITDNRFPDSICGRAFTPHEVNNTNFTFYSNPNLINANTVKLYPLLESQSKRVDLVMPSDVFRTTDDGIEFIDMESNSIEAEKSAKFTKVMLDKGFSFPAKQLSGNPSTRKEYDEGYLVLDSENKLFHLKQVVGRPYVRSIDIPLDIEISNVFITEFRSRRILGLLCDSQHKVYVLNSDYSISLVDIPSFDPIKESMTIYGNILDWTIIIKKDNAYEYYAINADDYSLIAEKTRPIDNNSVFGLHFTSNTDKYVYPRF
ncbi:MAG: DUF4857 domain-containing protein [Bacteroidales bacterium]|nr:DUF4857 domain-containing protein [Bacteroidales bacterium]